MPTDLVPFGNNQRSGDQPLAGASPLAINVVMDAAGAVSRRPGIASWSGMPAGTPGQSVSGLFDFEGALYVVYADRRVFKIAGGVATDLSTAGAASYLEGTKRPVFAETAFRLVIAGGKALQKVESGATVAARLGGSPPDSTHVVAVASRLVSNDLTDAASADRIRFTNAGSSGNEEWDALNVQTAEARPDDVLALDAGTNTLFVFGGRTVQMFNAGLDVDRLVFPTLATIQRGCAAPYSVIRSNDDYAWLTEERDFVLLLGGRELSTLSEGIGRTLEGVGTVSDAYGFRWYSDQYDCLCWVFPTDGRTFVVQRGGGWAQWHGWEDGKGHVPFPVTAHHYWADQNLHLVGMADGTIARLDSAANDDLGSVIKAEVQTGFINRGTDAYKFCQGIRLVFKRGHVSNGASAQIMLSWRDNLGAFGSPIRMEVGSAEDNVFTVERRSLGTYRSRQWKLEFTGMVDFVLARAEEFFTIGGGN